MQPGDNTPKDKGQPSIVEAALFGCCPHCGARTLFVGPVKFASRCRVCGLDYDRFNVGDGPAAFLTLVIGAVLVGLALWLDAAVRPPFWVHAVIWIPLTTVSVLAGLRVAKTLLLFSEFRNSAGEARSEARDDAEGDATK
ncbi:DUF983 domain-containing protein [Altererythrobacter aurantiacus]|uniref:DUF983 domain-containing protein n=1 Tax=Parapontixanthobacter aurantiacus TaxID=1463599 RepID=A0A844ZD68_9SPHN|nr:DUF983 domain-containing protein [Parapontixanthobacter aurantiacus]MXO84870.1 DUF983 domain-containing protein [Parapontixanthobacter aurantiacus]